MTLEELRIVISASTESLRREMEQVRRQLGGLQNETNRATSGIQNAFKKLVGGIIALKIGQKIGQAITNGIREAVNVEAAIQQIKRIMGESTNQFLKWADTQAIAFNMSKAEALKYGSVFGNLLMTFTKNGTETMKYTEDLLKASSIIASATGRTMTDVMERIRSGLLGNTEAIEDLGVNVNIAMIQSTEAFKKFANGKSWNQLDFQTQQQIRLMAILEQTSKKYGDTVANNTASQLQQLTAHLQNVKLSLGQAFMPIVQIVLPLLNQLAAGLSRIMGVIAQFMQALFGTTITDTKQQTQDIGNQSKAVSGLGDGFKDAGGKAKKAGKEFKGALAGFDEVNNLSLDQGGGLDAGGVGGSGGGASVPAVPMPGIGEGDGGQIPKEIQKMADGVKAAFEDLKEYLGRMGKYFEPAFIHLRDIFRKGRETAVVQWEALGPALKDVAIRAKQSFEEAIPLLADSSNYLTGQIRDAFFGMFDTIQINAVPFAENLRDIFLSILDGFDKIFPPLLETITNILDLMIFNFGNFGNSVLEIFYALVEGIKIIVKPGFELISTIIADILETINGFFDKHLGDIKLKFETSWTEITNIVITIIQGLSDTVSKIFGKLLEWWRDHNEEVKNMFTKTWETIWIVIEPIWNIFNDVAHFIFEALQQFFEDNSDKIAGFITDAWDLVWSIVKPIWDDMLNIAQLIFGNLKKFWDTWGQDILSILGDVWKGISRAFGGALDAMSGLFKIFSGLFSGDWDKMWKGVKQAFEGVWNSFEGLVKGVLNGIAGALNLFIDFWNSIKLKVPEVDIPLVGKVGGYEIGLPHIPNIPKLARGGIVDSPTLAMIGEAGKEAVVPLENTSFVDRLASALGTAVMTAMQFSLSNNSSTDKDSDINLVLDGTIFARLMKPYLSLENERLGNSLVVKTY